MSIQVLRSGPLTTVQDRGRFGYQGRGIGTAGAMDRAALDAANRLVGNRPEAAALEMTMMGAELQFDAFAICALTGADFRARLGGAPVATYQAFYVLPGQRLTLGAAASGCRGYLAVQGGIDVPLVLGSRSTDLKSALGGVDGRALRDGDVLPVGRLIRRKDPSLRPEAPQTYKEEVLVRAVPGPQEEYFTAEGIRRFYQESYTVTPQSDRMGIRLSGPCVENRNGVDIVSDAITFGSVQVPPNGQPIVLMADHQTTGGYAKIATVLSSDLPLLAQLRPGNRVRFVRTPLETLPEPKGFLQKLLRKISAFR